MKISNICIKRPVFTVVLSLVLIILGIMGYLELTIRAYPKEFHPSIFIRTVYPGASPQLVEESITQKLETALSDTPNLDAIKSYSYRGQSSIDLKFKDISAGTFLSTQAEVMQRVSSVSSLLPPNIKQPLVRAGGGDDAEQLMVLAIVDPNKTAIELGDYVQNNIVKPLQRLPGVANVQAWSTTPALRINLNSEKLKQYQLTTDDIRNAIEANNTSLQTGSLLTTSQSFQINTDLKLTTVQEYKSVPIKTINGKTIKLSDVANVILSTQSVEGGFHTLNGKQAVGVSLSVGDNANPIQLGNDIRRTMQHIATFFPPGMHYVTSFDLSKPLQSSVDDVFYTIFEAIALVALITFLFLGNIRASIIPMVTIPVCLISVFAIILVLGFSINMITLLAIVLAVGLVVDDAIVVLENTHRHIEQGLKPMLAAVKAMKEIGFAIIGITISLVAVYVPTIFMQGQAAIYFREFAFTLASAVLISGFVAITLSPMMCARVLKTHRHGPYERFVEQFFRNLNTRYLNGLGVIFKLKKWIMLSFVLLIIGGSILFYYLPSSHMPKNASNYIMGFINTPSGANIAFTKKANDKLVAKIDQLPSIKNIFSMGGGSGFTNTNFAFNFIHVKESFSSGIEKITAAINKLIQSDASITGSAFALDLNGSNKSNSKGQYNFMITGQLDYIPLSKTVNRFVTALNKYPSIKDATSDLRFDSQEYNIKINRVLASELNVSISDITSALQTMLGGTTLSSDYDYNGISYNIILQLPKTKLKTFANLQQVYVPTNTGKMLPVSRFVTIKPNVTLTTRSHYNEMRSALVSFSVNPKYTLGQAIETINALQKSMLPGGMQVVYTGEAKRLIEGGHSMVLIFILGIVFIFVIAKNCLFSFLIMVLFLVVQIAALGLIEVSFILFDCALVA